MTKDGEFFGLKPPPPHPIASISLATALGLLVSCYVFFWYGTPSSWFAFLALVGMVAFIGAFPIHLIRGSSLGERFRNQPRRQKDLLILISLATCLGVMIVGPSMPRIRWDLASAPRDAVHSFMLLFCVLACQMYFCTWLISYVAYWFLSRPLEPYREVMIPRFAILFYAVPMMLGWSIYHLGVWPVIMNADSGDQWTQIHNLQYDDWHPAFLAFVFWLISKVWDSPIAVVAVQTVALSCAFGWGLVLLRRAGLGNRDGWVIALLLAICPLNAMWVNCIAKDAPFSIVTFWLTLIIFEMVLTNGASIRKASRLTCLLLLLPPVMLFRHNGLAPALMTMACLMFAYRKYAMRLGVVAMCALAMYAGVKLWLYPVLKVTPTMIRMQPVIHLVAAHVNAGTPLTPTEQELLLKVHPLEDKWNYNPYRGDATMFHPSFGFSKFKVYPDELPLIALRLTLRNPMVTLEHFHRSTTYVWRMEPPETELPFVQTYIMWDDGARLRYMDTGPPLVEAPVMPYITHAIWHNMRIFGSFQLGRMIWSPAFSIYALIASVLIWSVRVGDWRGLLILVPPISNELAIAIGAGGEVSFRFHLPVFFSAVCLVGLLFTGIRLKAPDEQAADMPRDARDAS